MVLGLISSVTQGLIVGTGKMFVSACLGEDTATVLDGIPYSDELRYGFPAIVGLGLCYSDTKDAYQTALKTAACLGVLLAGSARGILQNVQNWEKRLDAGLTGVVSGGIVLSIVFEKGGSFFTGSLLGGASAFLGARIFSKLLLPRDELRAQRQ
jgi:hypothetical protein